MQNKLTLLTYLNDLTLSTRLVHICQKNDYRIVFPEVSKPLKNEPMNVRGLAIVDIDDPQYFTVPVIREIRDKTPFLIIGIIENVKNKWQKRAARSELDLIIPKSLLEQNLAVIIQQVQNGG